MIKQGTKEWIEFRRKSIGASDAPIVMEISPWKTPYKLWLEKIGILDNPEPTERMKDGLKIEEEAREVFYNMSGVKVKPEVVIHRNHKWMIASLDGLSDDKQIVLEIKLSNKEDHHTASRWEIPLKYYPQVQHQLEVVGIDKMFYLSCYIDPTNPQSKDWILVPVERNTPYINDMIKKEEVFYKCVDSLIQPELTSRDYHQISPEDRPLIEKWLISKRNLDDIGSTEKSLRDQINLKYNGKNYCGYGIRIQHIVRKGNIDYSQIKELRKIDLEKYRKEPSSFMKIVSDK